MNLILGLLIGEAVPTIIFSQIAKKIKFLKNLITKKYY